MYQCNLADDRRKIHEKRKSSCRQEKSICVYAINENLDITFFFLFLTISFFSARDYLRSIQHPITNCPLIFFNKVEMTWAIVLSKILRKMKKRKCWLVLHVLEATKRFEELVGNQFSGWYSAAAPDLCSWKSSRQHT